jgi:DNA-binding transcriptional ArsR family regulator
MEDRKPLDRAVADTYAAWFKALADGTRVQIVSLLARSGTPMTVREIVAAAPVGQSTVSAHLKQLATVGFVIAEEHGTSRLFRINENCVECFPTAADLVMGKPSPARLRLPAEPFLEDCYAAHPQPRRPGGNLGGRQRPLLRVGAGCALGTADH